ncbi:MAG: ABC transporter ATP-binding protein, partial [Acidobacteria bacterium]|nr:ABC transporter ATP-binding protein [Acidobacteriota bacterium]
MIRALRLPWRLVRGHPALLSSFALASLGRAALSSSTILVIHQFLAAVLGKRTALATRLGIDLPPWGYVALLFVAQLAVVLLSYQSRLAEQRLLGVVELGAMDRLVRHLLTLSVGFFDHRTHGDLVQTIRQDVQNLRSVATAA